jgi:hypothetical protein
MTEAWNCGVWTYCIEFEAQWSASTLTEFCFDASLVPNGATVDGAALRAAVSHHAEAIDRQAARFAANVASYLLPTASVSAAR